MASLLAAVPVVVTDHRSPPRYEVVEIDVSNSVTDFVHRLETQYQRKVGLFCDGIDVTDSKRDLDFLCMRGGQSHLVAKLAASTSERHSTGPKFWIGTLTGRRFPVYIENLPNGWKSLIEEVKEEVKRIDDIPLDQQRLICEGKQMEDGRTLSDYRLEENDLVHLVLRLRGGGGMMFADVSNDSAITVQQFAVDGPSWRMAKPGLCLEGKCMNSACAARGRMVIHNAGVGILFDLVEDAGQAKCPKCSSPIEAVTCAFNNCEWKFSGRKKSSSGAWEVVSSDWKDVGHEYCRFDEHSNMVEWSRLRIAVRVSPSTIDCSICFDRISPVTRCTTTCGHVFHQECLDMWLCNSRSCPLCRSACDGPPVQSLHLEK